MQNKIWSEIGTFLNGLRCGKVKRELYPASGIGRSRKRRHRKHLRQRNKHIARDMLIVSSYLPG